jgi:hypothetical protein
MQPSRIKALKLDVSALKLVNGFIRQHAFALRTVTTAMTDIVIDAVQRAAARRFEPAIPRAAGRILDIHGISWV